MATQTDRLLFLLADGTYSRNDPNDTLQVSSTWTFNGGAGKTLTCDENISQTGAVTLSTGTGTFTHNGATVFAGVAATASGAASFDLSGGSGIFKTSTGLVTVGPGAVTVSGATTFTAAGNALTVNNNAVITGNLTVVGMFTTTSSETVLINDNHLYLNNGYTTAVAQTGGLVVNYSPTATTDTVAAGGFVAGVPATSNPTVATTGAATFSASDIIQISGATEASNNGLFEVLSHAANVLTIRGIGLTGTVEDFTQNQFKPSAGAAGSIFKVNISVIRTGTDGSWETAKGAATPLAFTDLAVGTTNLQQAYDNGVGGDGVAGKITTNATDGRVEIAGDQQLRVTATGGLVVGQGAAERPVGLFTTTFDVAATGAVQINSSGGALQIGNSPNAFNIDIGTGGAARTITIGNVTGGSALTLNAGTGQINIGTTPQARTTQIATGGAAQVVTLGSTNTTSSVAVQAGTGGINIGTTGAAARTINIGTDGAAQSVFIGSINSTSSLNLAAGTGNIDIGISANARAVNLFTGGAVQTINMATGAAANLVTIGTTNGAASLTLQAGTGGLTLNVADNTAPALAIKEGANTYISVDSTNTTESVSFFQFANFGAAAAAGITMTSGEALTSGNIVAIDDTSGAGRAVKADANDAGPPDRKVPIGVVQNSPGGAGTTVRVATIPGTVVTVVFDAAPTAAQNGAPAYLSETAGNATVTAPTASGSTVFRVGVVQSGDGAATSVKILWMPQFIANNP